MDGENLYHRLLDFLSNLGYTDLSDEADGALADAARYITGEMEDS